MLESIYFGASGVLVSSFEYDWLASPGKRSQASQFRTRGPVRYTYALRGSNLAGYLSLSGLHSVHFLRLPSHSHRKGPSQSSRLFKVDMSVRDLRVLANSPTQLMHT